MNGTRVAVLTPAGAGAIATVAVVGPAAWTAVAARFRPAGGKPLPDCPTANRFWFGALGDGPGDEVVVAVKHAEPEPWVEVHCHGGRRVVRWVVEQFRRDGCAEVPWQELTKPGGGRPRACDDRALDPLTRAPTLRTAAVLLDQYHGAFTRSVSGLLAALDRGDLPTAADDLARLSAFAPVGRHLVAPWAVAVAGPPNVGKSSLINALAGYQRSVVAPVAGTTRDVVTAAVALDGWPVQLADTAGLREAAAGLEAEGISRARGALADADLIVWVLDAADPSPVSPDAHSAPLLLAVNKTDLPPAWDLTRAAGGQPVSAATGAGIPGLAARIAELLVASPPPPGAAVPFTPELAALAEQAHRLLLSGETAAARATLARCLPDA